ncbi:MAG: hypothetical protein HY422_03090 [Candidatus Komeilibacteria bacterium]|nr:hypothetical protein [Candidatus Komeilibacteria bacterium]
MEDDKPKKTYNPFPDEPEDGNTLVSEEDDESHKESEAESDEERAAQEQLDSLETPTPEEVIEEEEGAEEELERTVSEKPARSGRAFGSWLYPALVVTGFLIAVDYAMSALAHEFFWSIRGVYLASISLRAVLLVLIQYFWLGKRIVHERAVWYVVFGSIGFASGLATGIMRFVAIQEFWAFINLIIEPLDTALIALAISYLVFSVTVPLSIIKKQII